MNGWLQCGVSACRSLATFERLCRSALSPALRATWLFVSRVLPHLLNAITRVIGNVLDVSLLLSQPFREAARHNVVQQLVERGILW